METPSKLANLMAGLSLDAPSIVSEGEGIQKYREEGPRPWRFTEDTKPKLQSVNLADKVISHFRRLAKQAMRCSNALDTMPWHLLLNDGSLAEVDAGSNKIKCIVMPTQFDETRRVLSICYDI
jgi:hypothetical protein